MDYALRAAKALRDSLRAESGYAPPAPRAPRPRPVRKPKPDLWKIAVAVMDAVGNAVPDGDPIDALGPIVRRACGAGYWEACNVGRWLDRAVRKHLGARSYNEYLVDAWDGYNEICEPEQRRENPWRPARSR